MLEAIIIEDERPAMELMSQMLLQMPEAIAVTAKLGSVQESIGYLSAKPNADVIFSDVQLHDGLAFDIFEQTGVVFPVIFTTGYDKYLMKAFETNGIDYLLKPVTKSDVEQSIARYHSLQSHFTNNRLVMPLHNLEDFITKRKKTRLLVKSGVENIPLRMEDIALLYTQDKVVYVVDRFGRKYLCDKTLTELEEELDRHIFFRANRQHIISIGCIKSFKTYDRVKLIIEASLPGGNHSLVVSQDTAPIFKKWIQDA